MRQVIARVGFTENPTTGTPCSRPEWSSETSKTSTTTDTGIRLWATEHRPSTLTDAATPDTPWPARSTESGQQQPGSKAGWTQYQGHATFSRDRARKFVSASPTRVSARNSASPVSTAARRWECSRWSLDVDGNVDKTQNRPGFLGPGLSLVELPGIEPGSYGIPSRLLRAQFATSLLGSPAHANKSG